MAVAVGHAVAVIRIPDDIEKFAVQEDVRIGIVNAFVHLAAFFAEFA